MDTFSFAMQMEKDGENYYRELAAKSKNPGLEKIFVMLADEEVKHYRIFAELQSRNSLPEVGESKVLSEVKNVFEKMKDGTLKFEQGHHVDTTAETDAYRNARDLEMKSRDFYTEKAGETTDTRTKGILQMLAMEEDKHFRIMENIIEFVSRPEPGNWLENAEWHHLDDY
ncbi:MAG: ferritin-like domain-containing protein [Desulforhopalus sp.]